jgi:hypothetical protein
MMRAGVRAGSEYVDRQGIVRAGNGVCDLAGRCVGKQGECAGKQGECAGKQGECASRQESVSASRGLCGPAMECTSGGMEV